MHTRHLSDHRNKILRVSSIYIMYIFIINGIIRRYIDFFPYLARSIPIRGKQLFKILREQHKFNKNNVCLKSIFLSIFRPRHLAVRRYPGNNVTHYLAKSQKSKQEYFFWSDVTHTLYTINKLILLVSNRPIYRLN